MSLPNEVKFLVTMFSGLFGTLIVLMEYFKMKGWLTIGQPSDVNTVFFLTFVFSFLAGVWVMVCLEKWGPKN